MRKDTNYSWLIALAAATAFIIFAFWVSAQPGAQDVAPTPCEQVGTC